MDNNINFFLTHSGSSPFCSNDDYLVTIQQTNNPINYDIKDREFCLQNTKYGYRCISWHPHYIMTDWVKTRKQALIDGDEAINKYYDRKNNENILS